MKRRLTMNMFVRMLLAVASISVVVRDANGFAVAGGGGAPSSSSSSAGVMPPLTKTADHIPLAKRAMEYIDGSPDPYHAVQTSVDLLREVGFEELSGAGRYGDGTLKRGGLYYFTRNKSTLVAFAVGEKYEIGNGMKIIGGHTDSPNLRIKPRSKRSSVPGSGVTQIGVECYGGGLWHTWFDRDLGLSGVVMVRNRDDGKIERRLVKIDRALLRISNLAIHLQTADERKAFKVNKEDHLSPILAMEAKKALMATPTKDKDDDSSSTSSSSSGNDNNNGPDGWTEHQEPFLLQLLASELNVDGADIVDFDLSLYDVQKAALGGVFSEFLHSARLDNLASCFMAVRALVDHVRDGKVSDDSDVSMIVLYDHEEVGSTSAIGAASPVMKDTVRRITAGFHESGDGPSMSVADGYSACIGRSFVLSSDQAHAVHPNYAGKHEKAHQPRMNGGMVIKRNANQRYATNTVTGLIMREVARRASLPPVQEFIVRQDCGCGSTIGPLISGSTGIRAVDMGCPQLSMHSIRETMGVCDVTNGLELFKAFFEHFGDVDASIEQ